MAGAARARRRRAAAALVSDRVGDGRATEDGAQAEHGQQPVDRRAHGAQPQVTSGEPRPPGGTEDHTEGGRVEEVDQCQIELEPVVTPVVQVDQGGTQSGGRCQVDIAREAHRHHGATDVEGMVDTHDAAEATGTGNPRMAVSLEAIPNDTGVS